MIVSKHHIKSPFKTGVFRKINRMKLAGTLLVVLGIILITIS